MVSIGFPSSDAGKGSRRFGEVRSQPCHTIVVGARGGRASLVLHHPLHLGEQRVPGTPAWQAHNVASTTPADSLFSFSSDE